MSQNKKKNSFRFVSKNLNSFGNTSREDCGKCRQIFPHFDKDFYWHSAPTTPGKTMGERKSVRSGIDKRRRGNFNIAMKKFDRKAVPNTK